MGKKVALSGNFNILKAKMVLKKMPLSLDIPHGM